VIGLYRDEMDHPESTERGLAELAVLKKRQLSEEVGTVRRLVWSGRATITSSIASELVTSAVHDPSSTTLDEAHICAFRGPAE